MDPETQGCFISYSWESKEHSQWVMNLAQCPQTNGVYVHLDQWDLKPGMDLLQYMEQSIRDSNYVLLICTPTFAKKANRGLGGVGYEKNIVSGEIFTKRSIDTKFVPIIRMGAPESSLPSYLQSKVFVDFRESVVFEEAFG